MRQPWKRATLADVAALAKVDRSVVSRVVNNDAVLNVREETRQRVLEAIKELDYRPNAAARSLRTSRANAFGLLIPDYYNPVYVGIIAGAEAAALRRSALLLTGSVIAGDETFERFLELVSQGRVDGLLIGGSPWPGERAWQASLPTLKLNRRDPEERRYVILDDAGSARLAVEHLLSLGHKRIAHLAGPEDTDTATRRREGYESALQAAGIPIDEDLVVNASFSSKSGEQAMNALLDRDLDFTAVFVVNVASAVSALAVLKARGYALPEDISVISVHDDPLAAYLDPPLTTVRMPLKELGERGIELLATTTPEEPITETLRGKIELVERRSTAPPTR